MRGASSSARQRADEALRKQSDWLRVTLASIGDAVISTDAEGRVTFMNAVAESLTGWAQAEALDRPLPEVFHIVNERTRQPAENPALNAVREGRIVGLANHTVLIARDGAEWPIDDSASPMRDDHGNVLGAVLVFRDVTERKRAEEIGARLAAIIESSDDAIVSKTLDGVIRSWNAGAERLFGYTAAEAIGQPITMIIPPERLDEERTILDRLCRGERVEHMETVRIAKDGRRLDISLTVSPIRDDEGHVIGALKIARDITGRKQAETALCASEARYRAIVEATPECVKLVSQDGTLLQMNPAGLRMLETDETSAIGKSVYDVIAPEDRAAYRAFNERVCQGERGRFEFDMIGVKGTRRRMESSAVPLPADDGGFIQLAATRDISDRVAAAKAIKESEERYRRAATIAAQAAEANAKFRVFFEQGTNFASVLTVDGTVVEANRLCLEACGLSRDDVVGKPFWECPWWNRSRAVMDMIRGVTLQAAEGRFCRVETSFYAADGAERFVDLILASATDDAGRVLFVAVTWTDITERKRMEDALREQDRRKDEFLALLRHELRNPLAPLRNGLQVMRLSPGDVDSVAQARAIMERQLGHMVRLIDDLLDVSRVNRNKMELRRSRVRLADVISSAVEVARPMIEEAGHELTVSLPDEPVHLDVDLTRLAQVFGNLLTNSAKYTPNGGQIQLTATRHDNDVVVSVHDNGIGIPAESLRTIFDMFSQVDRSLERATGGLGIGLALVRGLVEMHGGTVAAESPGVEKGSTFTVRLPAVHVQPDRPTASEPSHAPAAKDGRRILVVDDNHDSARSMARLLKLLGNDVRMAHDGIEAIEGAADFRPDVILMDVGMPRLNGYEATRRIREHPWGQAIIIIALTGWGQEGDRAQAREAGCNGHLVKPVDIRDLEKLLDELAAGRKTHKAT